MQQLHDQALTEPEIPVYICTMPTSLGVLLGMHQEGIRMVSVGSGVRHPEPNPDAPLFEQDLRLTGSPHTAKENLMHPK